LLAGLEILFTEPVRADYFAQGIDAAQSAFAGYGSDHEYVLAVTFFGFPLTGDPVTPLPEG
jgi:hypothetical protein